MPIFKIDDLTATISQLSYAAGSVTLSGASAAGDGNAQLHVNGKIYSIATNNSESANSIWTRIAALFESDSEVIAGDIAGGTLDLTARETGSEGNQITLNVTTTDTNLTGSFIAMAGATGKPHAAKTITITSTALLQSITVNEDTLVNNGHELPRLLKEINWELSSVSGTPERGSKAIANYILGLVYPQGSPKMREYEIL